MFSEGIKKMIELYQGKMLVINCLPALCVCAQKRSHEPKADCPYCFGTGKRVKVKEIYGVMQESNGASTMRKSADYTITKELFIDAKYTVKPDDLIIFEHEVFKAYQIKTHRLTDNQLVYHIVYATPLKYDSQCVIDALVKLGVIA